MEKKDCFGILDNVFPQKQPGLREILPECFECQDRVLCLKQAISTEEGIKMREELIDRAAKGGLMGRFQRWSRKKELERNSRKNRQKGKR